MVWVYKRKVMRLSLTPLMKGERQMMESSVLYRWTLPAGVERKEEEGRGITDYEQE
jgi:hypothetical protein